MIHELPCSPEDFQAIVDGLQMVVLQKEDGQQFVPGDRLRLRERTAFGWDGPNIPGRYTGCETIVVAHHILRDTDGHWLQPGVAALSIRPLEEGRVRD